MNKLMEMIKVADIHASKIELALKALQHIMPIDASKVISMDQENFLFTELLINRFAKLQDLIGAKIVDAFFQEKEEVVDNLTMIDKLHKLERLKIIEDVTLWRKMREVRNYLAHEYPDHPEITANYINQLFSLSEVLLGILKNIKNKI